MINRIADKIASEIKSNVFWADTVVGIVTAVPTKDGGSIIPVYFDKENNNSNHYMDIVPDSKKDSLCYMEVVSEPRVIDYNSRGTRMSTTLGIVFWYNYQKINTNIVDSDLLMVTAIDAIPTRIANDIYHSVLISISAAKVKDSSIFEKYNYEKLMQYTMYPYDFFVIYLDVEYGIPKNCIEVIKDATENCFVYPSFNTEDND